MKWKLKLKLENVFGGDGQIRYEEKEKVKLNRKRTKTIVRESIGLTVEIGTEEEVKTKRLEPVNTFRFEGDTPMLRMGGPHGKLWGALKAAARQLYDLVDPDFKKSYKAVADMILVSPLWIPLKTKDEVVVEGIPQVLKGGAGMIVQYFDVLPTATAEVVLTFPDPLEKKVEKLLKQVEVGGHFNKRRTSIVVKKKELIE